MRELVRAEIAAISESQRDSGPEPRVARHELPWETCIGNFNPNGVVSALDRPPKHRWRCRIFRGLPRVARSSQPWAGGHNPLAIEADIRSAWSFGARR